MDTSTIQNKIKVRMRWMIRRDMKEVLKIEKESYSYVLFTIHKQDTKMDMLNIKNNIYKN